MVDCSNDSDEGQSTCAISHNLVFEAVDKRLLVEDAILSPRDCGLHIVAYEISELRAISGHMLGAAGVQIPENNLDDLYSSREEDGTSKTMDP
ncbi:hypothetical protein Tco_1430040 [Tanacetum coccineum]